MHEQFRKKAGVARSKVGNEKRRYSHSRLSEYVFYRRLELSPQGQAQLGGAMGNPYAKYRAPASQPQQGVLARYGIVPEQPGNVMEKPPVAAPALEAESAPQAVVSPAQAVDTELDRAIASEPLKPLAKPEADSQAKSRSPVAGSPPADTELKSRDLGQTK